MMKGLYISIILLVFFQVKAQHNVIMEALDAPGEPQFTITACTVSTIGWLGKDLPANTVDIAASQEISVNVISPGPYAFTTNTVNGVTFSASGTFTAPGVQNITLVGSGTPVDYTVDNATFTYTVTNTTVTNAGSCNFTRRVYQPDQNYTGTIRNDGRHRFLYKVITGIGGKQWLQTNLGAHYNQVDHPSFNPEMAATNVDDYLAFGSLFQTGRNSDGHEIVNWTSATSATGLSSTATPAPTPNVVANTGLFYTSSSPANQTGNFYGAARAYLGRIIIGPGIPCPTGFTVANENNDYGAGNYNTGSAALFNNVIKLVAPKLYRNAANGSLTTYNRRLLKGNQPGINPVTSVSSPQFVIEGGVMTIGGTAHMDRRASETYVSSTNYDARGSLDGYPVRCVKP